MQAGFTFVVGVDIAPQPNYRGNMFYGADAIDFLTTMDVSDFDLIHASPPCQHYSAMTRDRERHADLIAPTRRALEATGIPYVIENVERAPLLGYLRLCGSMFGLQVQRHRYFELSFPAMSLACNHKEWNGRPWTVTGKLDGKDWKYPHSWKPSLERAKLLMEMPWVETMSEIAEAIPPAYTKFIGEQFLAQHSEEMV